MSIFKKSLAMFLVLCMLFSAVPMTTFAADVDSTNPAATEPTTTPVVETTTPVVETTAPVVETTAPVVETTAPVVETTAPVVETTVPETEPVVETTAPVVETTVPETTAPVVETTQETTAPTVNPYASATLNLSATNSTTQSNKPADGTSSAQPFPTSVIGSGHYRIPAFVTTSNGTLVAAADARWHVWDNTDDNGDIDTIVSRSSDNGATWNYTFANYIDNGNTTDYGAATFIDPALAYDGKTIYMIVDLYPGQASEKNCTGSSKAGTGYDSNGNLLLGTSATAAESELNYYLSGGKILDASGNDQGYTVDAWFNVTDANGNSCGNLFDYDNTCGFHPLMTSHLYLTKSTDNGKSWSEPVMLNPQVKDSSDTYYLVSPGRGIVTSDDTIIFGAYDDSNQASIIYSTDSGKTWNRSANSGFTSSENEIVELSNGTLRMFYRYGYSYSGTVRYVDITKNSNGSYTWGSSVKTSASFNGNVNISAISYSKNAGGKQVILVSCPADTSGTWNRYNGYIYTFTFDGTNMELVASYDVDSSSSKDNFSYSCLTELANGSIGMLYEKGDSGNITYANFTAEAVTGLTFDSESTDPSEPTDPTDPSEPTEPEFEVSVSTEGVSVSSATKETAVTGLTDFVAYNVTLTKNGGNYTDGATITIPLNGKYAADVELWGFVVEADGTITYVKENVVRENDTVTFTAPHFSVVGATPAVADVTITDTVNVRIPVGGESDTYRQDGEYVTTATGLNTNVATVALDGQAGSEGPVYEKVTVTVNNLIDKDSSTWQATGYYYKNGDTYSPLYAKRSSNSSFFSTTYTYTWGYSDSASSVTQFGTQTFTKGWTNDWGAANFDVYKAGDITVAHTTVKFTGKSAGTTSAVIGTTQYNITVYEEVEITINYQVNGITVATGKMKVPSDAANVELPKQVVGNDGKVYAVNNTTLTLTGADSYNVKVSTVKTVEVTAANTPFTGNTGSQSSGEKISNLIIGTGTQYDLKVDGEVVWGTTSDKITVDQTGKVTGVTATDDGETVYVTAAVNGVIYYLPVTVLAVNTSGSTRIIDVYSQQAVNCTAYYSYRGNDLEEFPEGTAFYVKHSKAETDIICFFATPNPGYAMTYANGTGGDYFHAVRNEAGDSYGYESSGNSCNDNLGTKTGGYAYAHDQLIAYVVNNSGSRALTKDQVHAMLNNAVTLGCDAMFFFSRGSNTSDLGTKTSFTAEKLPTIDKTVDGVLPASGQQSDYRKYADGMVATVGEQVYFKITVTLERPLTWKKGTTNTGPITYTDAWVEDTVLEGGYLTDAPDNKDANSVQKIDITNQLNAAWGTNEQTRTIELYLVYKIQANDIAQNTLENTANLSYTYQSQYSHGASNQKADATASIDMMGKLMNSIVIDFGLPVTFNATSAELGGTTKGSAKYGDVTVTKKDDGTYAVTYTPNQILPAIDTVSLYNDDNKLINAFMVYPATTVHYEESFITWGDGWTGGTTKPTGTQQAAVLGKDTNNYGYDPAYVGTTGASNGTNATTSTIGATGTFTFTGTGIQVFANATEESGYVSVDVKNSAGKIVNLSMVDTIIDEGTTSATNGQNGNLYGLPIVSLLNLQNMTHDTYTVTITKVMDKEPVYIDGIRVFNTAADSNVFVNDLEDNPEFYELRDSVLHAINVGDTTSKDYGTVAEMADQVYNGISSDSEAPVAVITENNIENIYGDGSTAQDLLDNGPKNELFLYPGQTLTFNVTSARIMQIGLKAPQGATTASITGEGTTKSQTTVNSSVDMFYDLVPTAAGSSKAYSISIQNTGNKILSVTLLKVCDDPSFAFNALTAEDIEELLLNVYGLCDEETPTEPSEPEATEPSEPSEPEVTEPSEPEVTEPSEPETEPTEPETKPTKPNKPGNDKPGKPGTGKPGNDKPGKPGNNKPGRPAEDAEQTGAKATLNIVFVNMFGKKVATATLTKTGTANKPCVFSPFEILAQAPSGRLIMRFVPAVVSYGDTATIIVPVI